MPHYVTDKFLTGTTSPYDEQCRIIENSEEDVSSHYGICHSSILNQSWYFHVIGGLPGDDVLEGLLKYKAKEFIKDAVLYERYNNDT